MHHVTDLLKAVALGVHGSATDSAPPDREALAARSRSSRRKRSTRWADGRGADEPISASTTGVIDETGMHRHASCSPRSMKTIWLRMQPRGTETSSNAHDVDSRVSVRRRQLLGAGVALPLSAGAAVLQREMPWQEGTASTPDALQKNPPAKDTYAFLTAAEAEFLSAAVARLIPADDLGPGAVEAGAVVFIDHQLAGEYGHASRWYMQGPWAKGEKTQGYQSRYTPAGMYRAAIREIDQAVAKENRAATFARLQSAEQDRWLKDLEDGKPELPTVDARAFFKLLLQNTQEGFWSDPIYGGNRDMAGWKLIGFPGARYDHSAFVGRHGERYPLPPVGLKGRPEWAKPKG
jgi:gluconate 2-dehydrogenase gamma chain